MMANNELLVNVATILVPAMGGLVVGYLWRFVKETRPLGPADVIQSVNTSDGAIPSKSGLLTTVGSVISLGCGASVGQYGPLVLLGSTLGSRVGRSLGKVLGNNPGIVGVGCGSAAAIATVFNAPIAGLVFAHEVILRHYSIRAFAPVTVAATIGYLMANVVFNQSPIFRIENVVVSSAFEYVLFVVIGIVGALLATGFMRSVLLASEISKNLMIPGQLKPMLAGVLLGVIALWQPEILGIGSELLRFATIDGAFTSSELAWLILLKVLLTAICIGFGFAGGVFSPALLIGALFGAWVGSLATVLATTMGLSVSTVALYAVCGMVAVTSPVIGAPLTTILIVFELTRNYDLALACMASVVFANLVGYRIFGRSLFDVQLRSRGIDLSHGRDKARLMAQSLKKYVSQQYISLPDTASVQMVLQELLDSGRTEAYIVDSDGCYVGTVNALDLLKVKEEGDISTINIAELTKREALVLEADSSVWQTMKQIQGFVGESIPVVDNKDNGYLIGVVYEADLVRSYFQVVRSVREEEHANL